MKSPYKEKAQPTMVQFKNNQTMALLDTGAKVSIILQKQKKFDTLPQKPNLFKSHIHKVTSACGTNMGLIG